MSKWIVLGLSGVAAGFLVLLLVVPVHFRLDFSNEGFGSRQIEVELCLQRRGEGWFGTRSVWLGSPKAGGEVRIGGNAETVTLSAWLAQQSEAESDDSYAESWPKREVETAEVY